MKTLPWLTITLAAVGCGATSAPPPSTAPVTVAATVASADAPPTSSVPVPNAEKSVAAMRGDFHRCYADALAKDPKLAGSIVLVVKLDAKGTVTRVSTKGATSLGDDVENCLYARVQQGPFDAPGDSGSTLEIPITLHSP